MPTGLSATGIDGVADFADELPQNLVSDMRWELRGIAPASETDP